VKARDLRAEEGGRALLFDRLTDHAPEKPVEEKPLRTLSADALRDSIRREVNRILNTRCTTPPDVLAAREWTILDYGLPDYSGSYTRSTSDQSRLEAAMTRAILTFEPRLINPSVSVLPELAGERTLFFEIQGGMRIGTQIEPVSFPLKLSPTSDR
jgi:type VI secretion system protein ImpF